MAKKNKYGPKVTRLVRQPKPTTSEDPRERRAAIRKGGKSAEARLHPEGSVLMMNLHARGSAAKKKATSGRTTKKASVRGKKR